MAFYAGKPLIPSIFKLARLLDGFESPAPYHLNYSDAESWRMSDILAMADDECKALWANLTLNYTNFAGHPLLLKEIASLHGVGEGDVTVTGPQECIYLGLHAIFEYLRR